mmetsp:Transcript_33262/g.99281  ORF Transcript_33262/g.99281 Transcript_33262/m.99281 type:complete len:213 (-) Transcript_33262:701-1339(-)
MVMVERGESQRSSLLSRPGLPTLSEHAPAALPSHAAAGACTGCGTGRGHEARGEGGEARGEFSVARGDGGLARGDDGAAPKRGRRGEAGSADTSQPSPAGVAGAGASAPTSGFASPAPPTLRSSAAWSGATLALAAVAGAPRGVLVRGLLGRFSSWRKAEPHLTLRRRASAALISLFIALMPSRTPTGVGWRTTTSCLSISASTLYSVSYAP